MTETRILPSDAKFTGTGDLARLAFASAPAWIGEGTMAPRHLAFLPPEALDLDLNDPAQRDFGNYELLEKIGQGGMGVVYRARQKSLDREVALKLLAAGPWASTDFIARFQREAQSAARMEHPNIVTVYETGAYEDLNYFSMRLVRGRSLAARLAQDGPYACRDAARLMRTVAEAVDYAHSLDVLHLDLKPGNVLLDEHGDPLVADFGLARRLDQVVAESSDEVSGTPSYMAPEQAQARSQNIGAATDIYGLGAILYEMLTGHPPFLADTPQETLRRVVTAQPESLRSRRGDIPVDLEAICIKCLAKDPKARYQSARQVADDLGRFLDGREVTVRPFGRFERIGRWARRDPRMAVAAAALFASLVAGVTTTSLQWRRAEANAQSSRELLWEGRREAALQLEQDGNGYAALPRLLANIEEQEHAGKVGLAALERRRIGMMLGQGAVPIDEMVVADANPLAVELSPDGSLMALALSDLSVRWYDTATLRERGRVSLEGRYDTHRMRGVPRLLRFIDNHRLRATLDWLANMANPIDGDTLMIDLDRGAVVEPPSEFVDFADANYSADGRFALLRNRSDQAQFWQVSPWQPLSALTPAMEGFLPWLLGPDGRYAAKLGVAARELQLVELPSLSRPRTIELPGDAGVSAWSRSNDGHWLALGDFDGRVFLLDTQSYALRLLPTPHSREVTWLAFSEDDAWLAAVTQDGTAYAFDVRSGNPLIAGQMHQDFLPRRVGINHRHRLLVAAGKGETALWRLPEQGPAAGLARRVSASPIRHMLAEDYSVGWSLEAGLLASAGLDGQIRLWRLPLGPTSTAMAARQVPEQTWYDGRHLVDVEWNQLRIVSPTGKALTPWLGLPQPPGFAELLNGGATVLVTTGPQLRVLDARTLRLRYPPVPLVASPDRLLASADGSKVVFTFSSRGPSGFEERVQAFDLRTGRRLAGEAALAAPLRRMAFSPDGSRLLAVGPARGATTVLDAGNLHVLGEFPHDEFQPVLWADFSSDGHDVLLAEQAVDKRLGNDNVTIWDPAADAVRARHPTGSAQPIGVIATDTGMFVAGANQDLSDAGGPRFQVLQRLAPSISTAVFAISHDRRLVAHAFRSDVQIHDIATGANLGLPLQGDSDANDGIVQLAFATDGSQLLARTIQGHWRTWKLTPETRSVREVSEQLDRFGHADDGQRGLRMPATAERRALRAQDPGAWPGAEGRPVPAFASSRGYSMVYSSIGGKPGAISQERLPIPARLPGTSPLLLDLSSVYNIAPDSVLNQFFNIRPQMRPIPTGVQRIMGIDYDLRGMAQIGSNSAPNCVAVPAVPVSAFHVLLQISVPVPVPTETTMAVLRLEYRDGGHAELPIRTQRDVPGYAGRDDAVQMAFAANSGLVAAGYSSYSVNPVRLANPFPTRPIKCLDLAATIGESPLLLFGIAAEPVVPPVPTSRQ